MLREREKGVLLAFCLPVGYIPRESWAGKWFFNGARATSRPHLTSSWSSPVAAAAASARLTFFWFFSFLLFSFPSCAAAVAPQRREVGTRSRVKPSGTENKKGKKKTRHLRGTFFLMDTCLPNVSSRRRPDPSRIRSAGDIRRCSPFPSPWAWLSVILPCQSGQPATIEVAATNRTWRETRRSTSNTVDEQWQSRLTPVNDPGRFLPRSAPLLLLLRLVAAIISSSSSSSLFFLFECRAWLETPAVPFPDDFHDDEPSHPLPRPSDSCRLIQINSPVSLSLSSCCFFIFTSFRFRLPTPAPKRHNKKFSKLIRRKLLGIIITFLCAFQTFPCIASRSHQRRLQFRFNCIFRFFCFSI